MAEIPFWICEHQKWVSGITKHTTCQDVVLSLVRAERDLLAKPKDSIGETSAKYVLVEQWRGVEKPLNNGSKILKLWQAWGEEQKDVKFVVKRLSSHKVSVPASSPSSEVKRKYVRRKTSSASRRDTVHPKVFHENSVDSQELLDDNIEQMMKIIVAQGKVVKDELKKIGGSQPGAPQVVVREYSVDDIDAELDNLTESEFEAGPAEDLSRQLETEIGRTNELLVELEKLFHINSQLEMHEQDISTLIKDIGHQMDSGAYASLQQVSQKMFLSRRELQEVMDVNERSNNELEQIRIELAAVEHMTEERRNVVKQLEYDVNVIEKEGRRLHKEYEKVMNIDIDAVTKKEAEEDNNVYYELKELNMKAKSLLDGRSSGGSIRVADTASPGSSSSSGNSSFSEKSVRFNEQDIDGAVRASKGGFKFATKSAKFTKSILKPIESLMRTTNDDGDSNSDTGLSSLHSSTDEGSYEMGTLV